MSDVVGVRWLWKVLSSYTCKGGHPDDTGQVRIEGDCARPDRVPEHDRAARRVGCTARANEGSAVRSVAPSRVDSVPARRGPSAWKPSLRPQGEILSRFAGPGAFTSVMAQLSVARGLACRLCKAFVAPAGVAGGCCGAVPLRRVRVGPFSPSCGGSAPGLSVRAGEGRCSCAVLEGQFRHLHQGDRARVVSC